MEYVTPPRLALAFLGLFASEPDFAEVMGDLSEEFQQQASAHGHAAAMRWYWREAVRNAAVLGWRELVRTPGRVLAVSLLTGVSVPVLLTLVVQPVMTDIQWAWIPTRFWHSYQVVWSIVIPSLLYAAAGVVGSRVMRAREFALAASFAGVNTVYAAWVICFVTYSATKGRLPRGMNPVELAENVILQWALMILLYTAGSLWIRRRRLSGRSSVGIT